MPESGPMFFAADACYTGQNLKDGTLPGLMWNAGETVCNSPSRHFSSKKLSVAFEQTEACRNPFNLVGTLNKSMSTWRLVSFFSIIAYLIYSDTPNNGTASVASIFSEPPN